MSNVFCYCRASTLMQEMSPDVQQDLMFRKCEVLGLADPIRLDEVLGTSGKKVVFHNRPIGRWLMQNVQAGDTVLFTKLDRLGRRMVDVMTVLEKLCQRKVRVIILNFANGEPLDLGGNVQRFFLQIMAAVAEFEAGLISTRTKETMAYRRKNNLLCSPRTPWGRRLIIKDAAGNVVPGAKLISGVARRRIGVDAHGVGIAGFQACYEWDEQQLGYIAEIAGRRLLLEPATQIAADFHRRGIRDQTGRLFGTRLDHPDSSRPLNAAGTALRQVVHRFLQAGHAGELPGAWNDVALKLTPPRWTAEIRPPVPGDPTYKMWLRKKEIHAKKQGRVESDRSEWTLEQWQAWDALEGAG